MNRSNTGLAGLLFLASAFVAPSALADIARPDNGCPTVGAVCANAGLEGNQAGICTAAQCGSGATAFSCPKCVVTEASGGAGGASNIAGAGNVAAGSGTILTSSAGTGNGVAGEPSTAGKPTSSDDGGCTVRALGTEKGVATLLLGLGLAALSVSRRRR